MLEFELSRRAKVDLKRIWSEGSREWGSTQAEHYLAQLRREIESLCRFPAMGVSIAHIKPGHRSLHVQRHIVVYTTTNEAIRIVRVLHDSMDAQAQL